MLITYQKYDKHMKFAIYKDTVGVDPITIHKDTCTYYTQRKIGATTSEWFTINTLEDADKVGEIMANSQGCKHCNICLDGARIVNPKNLDSN